MSLAFLQNHSSYKEKSVFSNYTMEKIPNKIEKVLLHHYIRFMFVTEKSLPSWSLILVITSDN